MSGPRYPCLFIVGVAVTVVAWAAAGCAWNYNTPPTAVGDHGPAARDSSQNRVVVLGHLKNPDKSPVDWPDIGSGMSDALARTFLNHGAFDVWIDPPLAARVEALANQPAAQREAGLAQIRKEQPEVRFVIVGAVTDFTHTADKPREVRRWGMFGRKREAIVAIQINVIDLDLGRVVSSDHLHGVADAPITSTSDLYADMAFGSYLFWNSPLGRASEEAVNRAMDVLDRVVPTRDESIRIVKQLAPRRVRVVAGPETSLLSGRRYYVVRFNESSERTETVFDPATGMPLQAQIDSTSRISSTAWLLGQPPEAIDLRGAELRPELPVSSLSAADDVS